MGHDRASYVPFITLRISTTCKWTEERKKRSDSCQQEMPEWWIVAICHQFRIPNSKCLFLHLLVILLAWPLLCINLWGASQICCVSSKFNQTLSVKSLFCLLWLNNMLNGTCLFKTVDTIMWLTAHYGILLGRKFQSLLPFTLLLRGRVDFPILKPFLTDVVLSLALNKTSPKTDSAVQISKHFSTT